MPCEVKEHSREHPNVYSLKFENSQPAATATHPATNNCQDDSKISPFQALKISQPPFLQSGVFALSQDIPLCTQDRLATEKKVLKKFVTTDCYLWLTFAPSPSEHRLVSNCQEVAWGNISVEELPKSSLAWHWCSLRSFQTYF